MSTIETSVTRLLVLTKHLLESLTQWAHQEASDKVVLDAYVKLGNDFRAAVRSFSAARVDISDLGDVPRALRIVLESALSEEPTQRNLDKFLPKIRGIIVALLQSLKNKQARAKELAADLNMPLNMSHDHLQDDRPGSAMPAKAHILPGAAPEHSRYSRAAQPRDLLLASSDALAKLQKGNVILRRASKRFSAYQFAKLANLSGSHMLRISAELPVPQPGGATEAEDIHEATSHSTPLGKSAEDAGLADSYIFLRIGDKTKKVQVQFPMTMASLRLLFVEKFAYSPKTASFPEIYALDLRTNVSFELEEHRVEEEVKTGTLLLLKAPTDQEESLSSLESSVHVLNSRMDTLSSELVKQIKDALDSAPISAHLLASQVSQPATASTGEASKELEQRNAMLTKALKNLQQEFKDVSQILQARDAQVKQLTAAMQHEIGMLKEACLEESSPVKSRSFMEESYTRLSEDSDSLLTKVDDLQDMMEALRKDVAQRGVRLGAKQLKSTQKEICAVKLQLSDLIEYIRDGKPSWKKIWESELDKVCEEQQFFNLQDDLTHDLDEDIRKIEETFELIEKCSVHQSKQTPKKNAFASQMVLPGPGESMYNLRDAVLSEVCALKPDHESRLDAIAKAEKIRERERQLQSLTQFQEELGDFVDEKKLKSSGGIEDLEKRRQQQDAENLKSSFGVI
ncbi:AIP3-domain-containing protein [Metschnikowia bicuspidata var. bicuspidata NRRL YB-4993]|uniref:AIP3-domain-containing protein n=1 Tax=Metschnikowia bicuspidata var. bicuspidata NRRL YB-4993 TaxID=869754 RepID=A0A1A0HGS4_9ASCO|nr:AIP3-domain-containing protein [Metschnikowia bicuspidata var. bicuspidata NRRL YB-4993]OBA23196.1 AIP3-domain-containing protein [Metschnikowia bicuspidata var. bicuspidata NRRL YB-4993]